MPTENPLLSKLRIPGKMFQLPSAGLLYSDELAQNVVAGEIHVHPLTAFEEIILKNPDMLFSGRALEQVLKTAIPDIVKPGELYGKDVDAIMLFLRLATYGPEYEVNFKHSCEKAENHSYIINLEEILNKIKYLDPTVHVKSHSLLMSTGQQVQLQPIKYADIMAILQDNDKKEILTADDLKKNLLMSIVSIVKSVDGIEDKQLISEWALNLQNKHIDEISKQMTIASDWGPNLEVKLVCKDCGAEIIDELPINPISFF